MTKLNFDATRYPVQQEPSTITRTWSQYQTTIFNFVGSGCGNAIVKAVAGSGKTTTCVEALEYAAGSSLFLAFNKSIADELKARGVNARTFHSLTYSAVTRFKDTRNIDGDKLHKLMQRHFKGEDAFVYGSFVARLVGLARQSGVGVLLPDVQQVWLDLVVHHDLELENERAELGRALELASELLSISTHSELIDFDDLLYLAVKEGLQLPKFDIIFVDEAQDTNSIQRAILRKIMHPNSRLIAVGDPAQAIYGFRGADSNSLDLIAQEFNCIQLPLTVSYRCPKAVVKHAQRWYKEIEPAPNAQEGSVYNMGAKWSVKDFKSDDLVVCRTTKPLITLALKAIKSRIPAYVMGREIGQGLISLINQLNAGNLRQLESNLNKWEEREIQKAIARRQDSKAELVADKADAIRAIIDSLEEHDQSIDAVRRTIDHLFADKANAFKLATIHKAKGLEADRVYWLNSSKCPAKWATQEWQQKQEENLCYVATTRAKKELFLIESDDGQ